MAKENIIEVNGKIFNVKNDELYDHIYNMVQTNMYLQELFKDLYMADKYNTDYNETLESIIMLGKQFAQKPNSSPELN